MGRIEMTFKNLKEKREKALIAYITAGVPSLDKTKEIILGLDKAGVDIIEIGVPFSDPTADGPVIQASALRALKNKVSLRKILDMIQSVRNFTEIPIVLFGYYNPIFVYGNEKFAKKARDLGIDGLLVVDLPFEESLELRKYTDASGIDFISLIAPTSTTERVQKIAGSARGFLYYISITGVTGTAKPHVTDITKDLRTIQNITDMPVVVGFGISTAQQANEIAQYADGVVIGSAFMKLAEDHSHKKELVDILSLYAREIKNAIR